MMWKKEGAKINPGRSGATCLVVFDRRLQVVNAVHGPQHSPRVGIGERKAGHGAGGVGGGAEGGETRLCHSNGGGGPEA